MPVGSPWPMNQHPDTARAEIAEARVVAVERDRDEIAIRCADDVASAGARVAELEAALRTAHYWMQLGFNGEAAGRSGAGEADAEVRAALANFPPGTKGNGAAYECLCGHRSPVRDSPCYECSDGERLHRKENANA